MTETETETKARREITFSALGISGVHGTFQHEKQTWMAAPVLKARALFNRAQYLADRAGRAHKMLLQLVERRPDLYPDLRAVLVVLETASGRVPWGAVLDAEIAAQAEARAAAKKRRIPKFTH